MVLMMIYSRLLYTEYEQPHHDDGEGAYTIFSTQQIFGADCIPLDKLYIQRFAVLWEGQPDTRVIDLIEQAIILTILSPVKILNASKGTLVIVYDSKLVGKNYILFRMTWEKIAAEVMYDEWTALFIKDSDAGLGLDGGRIFRKFSRGILENNVIGIVEFTPDMFLFKDDWTEEAMFGSGEQQDSRDEPPPDMKPF